MSLYHEVQHFYGRQMRYLDSGETERWAGTFARDGVFSANAHPEPQRGRAAIEEAARKTVLRLAEQGVQRRHWLGMLEVDEQQDGTVLARTYALVVDTVRGGTPDVLLSCACDDILVREDSGFAVRHRQVYRDDLVR
jgi:hypothetical protein